jgi:hypothetical protein
LLEQPGLRINSHDPLRGHVLKHIRRKAPGCPALLGGRTGDEIQKQNPKTSEAGKARLANNKKIKRAQSAHKTAFDLPSPVRPPSSADWSGDFGEDCLSAQREFRSRLTSRATQGTPQGRRTGVAFSLVTFFWRSKRK